MQGQAGKDGIEALGGKRQPVILGCQRRPGIRRQTGEGRRRIGLKHGADLARVGNHPCQRAVMAPKIKAEREITAHQLEPVGDAYSGLLLQEVEAGKPGGGPRPVTALRDLVEQSGNGRVFAHDEPAPSASPVNTAREKLAAP